MSDDTDLDPEDIQPSRGDAGTDNWHLTDDLHAETGKGDPFAAAMRATRMPMIITNPRLPDNPIVFANESFLRLTGYARAEVVGRNCRFLQGPETDPETVDRVREAIAQRRSVHVDLLNYRKDGSTFWNALYVSPVTTEAGETQFFFASQLDVTANKMVDQRIRNERADLEKAVHDRTRELEAALEARTLLLHEVDHRVKNNLQMISSLIDMQSRDIRDESVQGALREMLGRIEALSTVHRRLYQSDDVSHFDIGAFARDIVTDLVEGIGHPGIKVVFDCEPIDVTAAKAAPIGLMMNEIVTNALKHGFADGRDGTLTISVRRNPHGYEIVVADDGDGMKGEAPSGFGQRLVRALARQLQARLTWNDANPGTRVVIDITET